MTSSTWSHSPAPARLGQTGASTLLVIAEAGWASLVFDALADGTAGPSRPSVDLPFLAFALPAAVALAGLGLLRLAGERTGLVNRHRRLYQVLTAAAVLVGAATSAGLIAGLSAAGITWTVALHPWGLPAHATLAVRAAKWGWATAVLAWGRAAWLGAAPPTLHQAGGSLVVGGLVFVAVFASQAASDGGASSGATGDAVWLMFVSFPVGVTAAAWIHQRDLERRALRRSGPPSSGVRQVLLVAPLILVALVAFAAGGAATVIGPGIVRAVRAFGAALGTAGNWFFAHLPSFVIHPSSRLTRPVSSGLPGASKADRLVHSHEPTAFGIVLLSLVGVAVVVVVVVLVRMLLRWARRRRATGQAVVTVHEVRESVFSWSHLVAQLRVALRSMLARVIRLVARTVGRRPRTSAGARRSAVSGTPSDGGGDDSVRAAYRRFLAAARMAAYGRAPSETPRELATRLFRDRQSENVLEIPTRQLSSLTTLYEAARYAGDETSTERRDAAWADAETLVAFLRSPVDTSSDATGLRP